MVAELGNGPWTVLAEGVTVRTPLSIGSATFVISIIVLALWIPLREKPGLGTIANAVVIAAALQVGVWFLPHPEPLWLRLVFVFTGVALIGLGSGLYLTTNMGPGPRDGWMTGIHHRFGIPVARVRLGIEVSVLILGWLLGGTVGLGTVVFALLIGPSVGWGLRLMDRGPAQPGNPSQHSRPSRLASPTRCALGCKRGWDRWDRAARTACPLPRRRECLPVDRR